MADNNRFLIARRRNEQRLHGGPFLLRLKERTGLTADQVTIVDAERSLALEAEIHKTTRDGIRTGSTVRHCHLQRMDALARFRFALGYLKDAEVIVLLCHTPDFMFSSRAYDVGAASEALFDFDGDTVTVATLDCSAGVAIDLETESNEAKLCELDLWGVLRHMDRVNSS